MRRTQITRLVGIDAGVFNALGARDLLPFSAESRRAGWGTYTADQAFRLALFRDLTAAGRSQLDAASLVREGFEDLMHHAEAAASSAPMMFGAVWTVLGSGDEAKSKARFVLIASLGSVDAAIAARLTLVGQGSEAVHAVVAINATQALASLLDRAKINGDLDERFAELAAIFGVSL